MTRLLLPAESLVFERHESEVLSAQEERLCAEHWAAASEENPALFDGPILLSRGAERLDRAWTITFSESTYARYLWLRRADSLRAGALYVAVLAQTSDSFLLLGEMAPETTFPGRIQLPGGNVEPQEPPLDLSAVQLTAVRELAEETGLQVDARSMRLSHLKYGGTNADLGILFKLTLDVKLDEVGRAFSAHQVALAEAASLSEFTRLVAVEQQTDGQERWEPPAVDYMNDALRIGFDLPEDARFSFVRREEAQDSLVHVGLRVE